MRSLRALPSVLTALVLLHALTAVPARAQNTFGPETRIGDFGTVPGLVFAPDGTGHMVYRRAGSILYRRHDGTAWGPEVLVNSGASEAESEFKDRNQPKITRDPTGRIWIVWGGKIRDADKNLYLRGFNANGTVATAIKNYRYQATLLNPEEVAGAYDPATSKLHLYGIWVGDPTKKEDGHYDLTIDPSTLTQLKVDKLAGPLKNIYGFTGQTHGFAFARLHNVYFYRTQPSGNYERLQLVTALAKYSIGAMRFTTLDDRIVHFGVVSTDPAVPSKRDVTYIQYDAGTGTKLGEVMVQPQFDSPWGLAHPAATAKGNIFLTWDAKRPSGKYAPAFAYRLAGAAPGAAFSAPAYLPDYPENADAQAPAAWAVGEKVHVIWGDAIRGGLYERIFDFALPVPDLGPLALLALGLAFGLMLVRPRAGVSLP